MGRWFPHLCFFAADGDGGGGGGGGGSDSPKDPPKPPADPPKDPPAPQGIALTAEQAAAVARGEPLVLNDDQFKGGVQQRLNTYAAEKRTLEAKVKEHEDAEAERKRKKLEDQGKFKELLDLERAEKVRAIEQLADLSLKTTFATAASKVNIGDTEAAYLLAKASPEWANVKVENGAVVGLEAALEQLVKDRPYLVQSQSPKPPIGGPSNPDPKTPEKEPPKTFEEAKRRMQSLNG